MSRNDKRQEYIIAQANFDKALRRAERLYNRQ